MDFFVVRLFLLSFFEDVTAWAGDCVLVKGLVMSVRLF